MPAYLGPTVIHRVSRFHDLGMHALTDCGRLIALADRRYLAVAWELALAQTELPECSHCRGGVRRQLLQRPRGRTKRFLLGSPARSPAKKSS